jgi:hypothetical protein
VSEFAWVLVAFASAVVAVDVAVVLALRSVYRRIRRNRGITGAALRIRSRLDRGPRGEVLRLRVRLNEALDSGRAAIELAVRNDGLHGELPRLFRRLRSEGDALEAQLRLLESENDSAVLAEMVPDARRRVDHVVYIVRQLRSAVASVLGDPSDDGLTALRSEIDREITAVRAGMRELHELNHRSALSGPDRQPSRRHQTAD